jgi:anthranilate synthase/aminodeoxychorismate synthase-like glutamine amidotransferase
MRVFRNDAISVEELSALAPQAIVISPGPGDPDQAGISCEVIRCLGPQIPILGVCLGHQCIGAVYGGVVRRAPYLMHGKTSSIIHNGQGIFSGLSKAFEATRYHSLVVAEPLPEGLEATAHTADGILMGLRHRLYPIFGVQFHPESILTDGGKKLLQNFINQIETAPAEFVEVKENIHA